MDILQYLDAGGKPRFLLSSLEEKITAPIHYPVLIEKDFTADGLFDIALTLINPETEFQFVSGELIFYHCKGDHYELIKMMDMGNPVLFSSDDLNDDGIPDLIVGLERCGAHTCYIEGLQAFIWNGETWENRLQGVDNPRATDMQITTEDIPSPVVEIISDKNEILVTGGSISSFGAGPSRQFMRRWTWDPKAELFLPSPDFFFPSEYRIHALLDADQSALDENYDRAIELYTRVIEDDELLDWFVIYEEDLILERARLGAYASFRLMIVHLLMENFNAAEATYATIMANYPASGFAQMAEKFWVEYQSGNDVGSACLAAQSFVLAHPGLTIDLLYFGYANPEYEPEDICPYSEDPPS